MDLTAVHQRRRHEAPDMEAFLRRGLMALARRAGEGDMEAVEALSRLQVDVDQQLAAGVAGMRGKGYSWGQLAQPLGVTRQAAQQRWAHATIDAAHGPRCRCGQGTCPRLQLQLGVSDGD